jgi:DNA-binding MarR family transcriptional regulator
MDATTDHLPHLLREVAILVALMGDTALASTRLTVASADVLDRIVVSPGITGTAISRVTRKSQQAISQVALRLQRLGFVEQGLACERGTGLHGTEAARRRKGAPRIKREPAARKAAR